MEQKAKEGTRYFRLFILLLSVMLALLVAIAVVVVYVDPFFHYHAPLPGFPYIVDNQLSQNPGMAKNMDYNACIIGSSMTVNFDTDDFKELMGLDTLKLSCDGAYPKDDYNILSIVFDKTTGARIKRPVDAVFFAMDIPVMTEDTEATKNPRPEYLYDKNLLNDVNYVLNKDVLTKYILWPMIQKKCSDMSEIYASWWTPEYYNIRWVMQNYEDPAKVEKETAKDALIQQTGVNLDINILPFVRENPGTQFYFFFPPYSVLYWHGVMRENKLEATMMQYQYVAERLLEYDNVHVFYFQNIPEVTDLNNYADYTHYKPEINHFMVECFKSGACEIHSPEQMKDELLKMRGIIEGFDYDGLLSVDWG